MIGIIIRMPIIGIITTTIPMMSIVIATDGDDQRYSHDDEHSLYHSFTTSLQKSWQVDDEGPVSDLLNIESTKESKHCVVLRQTSYIHKMFEQHAGGKMDPRFQLSTPPCATDGSFERRLITALTQDVASIDPALLKRYQSLVGALLYAAMLTRPDIAFAVHQQRRAIRLRLIARHECVGRSRWRCAQ